MDFTALTFGGVAIVSMCTSLIMYALLLQSIVDKRKLEKKYIAKVDELISKLKK